MRAYQDDLEEEFEDIHSKIEFLLTEKLGDLGKKIHTARSRNDQVLTYLKIWMKASVNEIDKLLVRIIKTSFSSVSNNLI